MFKNKPEGRKKCRKAQMVKAEDAEDDLRDI
jgi:hypothetical protein